MNKAMNSRLFLKPVNMSSSDRLRGSLLDYASLDFRDGIFNNYVDSVFADSDKASKLGISNDFSSPDYLLNSLDSIICLNDLLYEANKVHSVTLSKNVKVTSAYRNKTVNAAVGGSPTSLHVYGLALDFYIYDALLHSTFCLLLESLILNPNFSDYGKNVLHPVEMLIYSDGRFHVGFKYYY